MNKKSSKKIWIFSVFAVFVALSMSFVSWLIYAVFADNYREIKQQYYALVTKQTVDDIENSVKNGKTIERFYGMDNVLNEMLELISSNTVRIRTAVTGADGNVLYSSYATDPNKDSYNAIIASEIVQSNIVFPERSDDYKIVISGDYEFMLQPIFDTEGKQIGAMEVFYRSEDIDNELLPQKQSSNIATIICISATILILLVYFLSIPRAITEDSESGDTVEAVRKKQRRNIFVFIVPVTAIMVGLLVQCVMSYNEYQKRYKEVMFEGATGICEYLGSVMDGLRDKGVPYHKMNGLQGYLAGKVDESQLLWNISVESVYADTSDVLDHASEYNICYTLETTDVSSVRISVEISKDYIDEKMMDMLLVFAVTFIVALIMIYELLKFPDILFSRISKSYRSSPVQQSKSAAGVVRLGAFIAYTGMYIGIPFSSVLITQWNKSIFGLSVTFLASIPMTAELLAVMLCSLFLLPLYKRMNLKLVFTTSAGVSVIANALCFLANSPEQLIILRFVSGIGFAGIKYALNTIVSESSLEESDTTNNLAALNAGLLGGITCGGTLGAVIASSISVNMSYFIAAMFILAFIFIVVGFAPWKLVAKSMASAKKKAPKEKKKNSFTSILNPAILRYMLLVALPLNFGLMFVVAFFPSFVTALGLPDVTTSYGYLINGLVGIYIGPILLNRLSRKLGKTTCVILSLLLGAVSVFILNVDAPLVISLVSVALLGLFDGFGTPATSDYYVNMPVIKELGVSQGLAVLSVVGSVIQTFSPMLYSVILASGNIGVNVLGLVFVGCAVLFIMTIRLGSKKEKKQHEHS
ncbi:MAG: MFS transporter [Oscillospiraceae bacterium]